jgi:hypothetical protein
MENSWVVETMKISCNTRKVFCKKQELYKNVLKISFTVIELGEEMFSWCLYKRYWIALFILLTFKDLLTYFGQGAVA